MDETQNGARTWGDVTAAASTIPLEGMAQARREFAGLRPGTRLGTINRWRPATAAYRCHMSHQGWG